MSPIDLLMAHGTKTTAHKWEEPPFSLQRLSSRWKYLVVFDVISFCQYLYTPLHTSRVAGLTEESHDVHVWLRAGAMIASWFMLIDVDWRSSSIV